MTRQEAVERLNVSLTEAIENWWDGLQDSDPDTAELMGWIGNDCMRLMARAGMTVLEASADVQEYLKDEGQMVEESMHERT